MKVPVSWLKEYVDFDLTAQDLAATLTMGGLEVEEIEESATGAVLDVYITPNRGDCLSILGVAREVAALTGGALKAPDGTFSQSDPPSDRATVRIDNTEQCPRYGARIVRNVTIGPSPAWLQERLEAAGQRSVNNVVDITNYVMLELGQPLHAFDFDLLHGGQIIVRNASEGESIKTLDGEDRKLDSSMLVIADAETPVAIAGIMGGADSEVSESTTSILLESAHFHPLAVRRTSQKLALRTEASYRFERIVDPAGVVIALNRVCELLAALGQPLSFSAPTDVYPASIEGKTIDLRPTRTAQLLGMPISPDTCVDALTRLGFVLEASADADTLHVVIPTRRPDLTIEEDLIEEIGRVHGYENIPESLPRGITTHGGDSKLGTFITRLKSIFVASGLQEVVTHSLTAPSPFDTQSEQFAARRVPVRNALSTNVSGLRRSLLPTMLDVAQANAARGQSNLALFEIGRVWQNELVNGELAAEEYLSVACLFVGSRIPPDWQRPAGKKSDPADYTAIKGVLDHLLAKLNISGHTLRPASDRPEWLPQLHPGRAATISLRGGRPDGIIGELHPEIAARLDLRNRIYLLEISLDSLQRAAPESLRRYSPISRQQSVSRDIAPRVPNEVPYAAVAAAIESVGCPVLTEFRLLDVFVGAPLPQGVRSITISLTFGTKPTSLTDDRAVTEQEVIAALTEIRGALETRCDATFVG